MSSDVLANFSCLDELAQVIYQGVYRFVVLSAVSDEWVIHLGLSGSEGRWWRGSWSKTDILHIVGSKSSDKLLETFAEKLAEAMIQGELHVADWSPEKGAMIKLNFGPSSKKSLNMPLVEISSAEAASYATNLFLDIALQAQSRKCRLHPDPFATPLVATPSIAVPSRAKTDVVADPGSSKAVKKTTSAPSEPSSAVAAELEEIKALKAELKRQKERRSTPPESNAKSSSGGMKGASLANPNKRARKYQAIEFASDEE